MTDKDQDPISREDVFEALENEIDAVKEWPDAEGEYNDAVHAIVSAMLDQDQLEENR